MVKDVLAASLRWLGMLLFIGTCHGVLAEDAVIIKHYDKDFSWNVRQYLTDVLHLTLQKSKAEFGDYRVEFYSKSLSPTRSKMEAERGELINTLFAPDWRGPFLNESQIIRVPFPVFKGLLGFRCLIVHKSQVAAFSKVATAAEFKALRAGQGASWAEVDILKAGGLQVVEAQSYESLFPMLIKGRYDYLPLSALEASDAMDSVPNLLADLSVIEGINIFYPVPFSLYVNRQQPELARRFARGLELAMKDGSLDALFIRFFPGVETRLDHHAGKLMVLSNPLIDSRLNDTITREFMEGRGAGFEVLR